MNEIVNALRGCVEAPYIVWGGWFLGEKIAGSLATEVGMAVATFLPKLRGREPVQVRPNLGFGRAPSAAFIHRLLQGDW